MTRTDIQKRVLASIKDWEWLKVQLTYDKLTEEQKEIVKLFKEQVHLHEYGKEGECGCDVDLNYGDFGMCRAGQFLSQDLSMIDYLESEGLLD